MDWAKIINHAFSFLLLIVGGSCIWLLVVLYHAVKKSRKLKRMLGGKEKMIIEKYEEESF